jgi:hypothetical protein
MEDWQLQKELERYSHILISGSATTGIGLGFALLTFGLSAIAAASGAAQMANASKKMDIP